MDLVKITQHIDSYVAPQEEAAEVEFKEKAADES